MQFHHQVALEAKPQPDHFKPTKAEMNNYQSNNQQHSHDHIAQRHQQPDHGSQLNVVVSAEAETAARNNVNNASLDTYQQLQLQIQQLQQLHQLQQLQQQSQNQSQTNISYLNQFLSQNSANSISNDASLMPPTQQDQLPAHLMVNLLQNASNGPVGTNLASIGGGDSSGASAALLNNGGVAPQQNRTTGNTLSSAMLATALPGQHVQHNLIHQNGSLLPNNPANTTGSNLLYNSNSFSQNYLASATSDSNPNTTLHGLSTLHNLSSLFSGKQDNNGVAAKKNKKKRKKKNQNQQNRPPRPLSAYNLFFKDERKKILASFAKIQDDKGASNDDDRVAAASPADDGSSESNGSDSLHGGNKEDDQIFGLTAQSKGVGFENLAKTIGRRWKKISPERLEHYKALAKKDQDRYAEDMKVHEEKLRELWFQEQAAKKKEQEAKEVEAAEKANTFNTNDSKNPAALSSSEQCNDQGSDDDMTRGDGNEKRSRAGSKSVISIDAIADNDGSRTKKHKTSNHEQIRQQQQQLQLPSTVDTSSEINQGLESSLFASSGQNTNAHQTLHGSNNLALESTRLAVNQLELQIENLLRLKNQLIENSLQQQLLQEREQHQEQQLHHQHQMTSSEATHQNNDLVQTLAQQVNFVQQGQVQNRPTHDSICNNPPVNNQIMLNDMNAGLLNHTTGATGGVQGTQIGSHDNIGGLPTNENILLQLLNQQVGNNGMNPAMVAALNDPQAQQQQQQQQQRQDSVENTGNISSFHNNQFLQDAQNILQQQNMMFQNEGHFNSNNGQEENDRSN